MKIMISQPMKGRSEEEIRNERNKVIEQLTKEGHKVVETIFGEAPENTDKALWYLGKSIDAMSKVDCVVFMPGWNKARGCAIEYQIACAYCKYVKILEE